MSAVEELVPGWVTVPDLAEAGGVPLSTVRTWLQERLLLAVRRGERTVVSIPETFVQEGAPLEALRGTLSVLHDSGLGDAEAIEWLHTPDDSLRTGTPIGDLRAGHKTEIRRRAQELAF
ncbi:hypothetical protein ADJ73_13490 [Arsenicicoccus sp. oral taxon 190]|nr:hypothetical protein ADJ73_13490 [Arsenicicoccus sp. oral taxon 190]